MQLLLRRLISGIGTGRLFHTSISLNINPRTVEEVRIPVPWGHIAGKWWGDKSGQPAVALHGWLDNSNTFDKLIPFLNIPSILCIDLSGHGKSSHLQKGISIECQQFILQIRYLLKYQYQWEKNLVFLGHSFGSSIAFNYAAIFPNDVSKMINIDCARIRVAIKSDQSFVTSTKKSINGILNMSEKYDLQEFKSFDECVEELVDVREKSGYPLSKKNMEVLCTRGTYNLGNGKYYLSEDERLYFKFLGRNTDSFNLELASRIRCEVLDISANGGVHNGKFASLINEHFNIMKKNCKSFKNIRLDGGHHIHMESPQLVADEINIFLNN